MVRKLMVVPGKSLNKIKKHYKDRLNLDIVSFNSKVPHMGYDEIYVITASTWATKSMASKQKDLQWLNNTVKPRLKCNGVYLEMN